GLCRRCWAILLCGRKRGWNSTDLTEMPPRFAVPVTDIKVAEGLDAVFECVVTGTPVPVVQWFRGDACATPGTGKYVVSQKEGLHSLKVKNVGPSDSGLYRCQATNRLGEATCKGSLVVMAQHEANAVNSETVTGCEPHRSQKCDLLLSTTVSPGDQSEIELEFEFEPHKDGSEKPSEEERVEFRAEDSESCSFEFQVTEAPPRFVRLISDYSTFVGASVSFQCLVTGSPCPSVRWYKDGVLLEGDRYCAQEDDHSLILPRAGVQDEGEYRCVASSAHGETSCSAQLHVRHRQPGSPCFARQPGSVLCAPGSTAVFEYTVEGRPCPDVLWSKGSERLLSDARRSIAQRPDGSGSLTVWHCVEEDSGLYTCRAVSALGEATCSAELLVLRQEHSVSSQSLALQHPAVAEEQSPLFYEEAGELPAVEEAFRLEPRREPSTLLQLQMSQAVYMLPREDILPGLPPTCLAAQSVEEMLTQAATIQESSGLLAEPLETLPAGPQGVVPAAVMETQLPGCLGTVAAFRGKEGRGKESRKKQHGHGIAL
uniref:Ig-like domain-containing protein n=1 Tax=Junco hyemalis TaxID=40217 RepID=A0A8C5J976_JUNHY